MTDKPLTNRALSIEQSQRIEVAADGTATRGYETFIKKYVGMIESGLLAKLTGTANKLLDAMGLRARILADPRRPGSEAEFQLLKQLGIATDKERGELFCFSSLEQLARDTGISSLHTVEAGIDQLIKLQIVRKMSAKGQARLASGRFGSNVYFIQPASFIGKFDSQVAKTTDSDGWQKLPTENATVGNPPITVNCIVKRSNHQQKEEEGNLLIARHFAETIGVERYAPNEKEIRKLAALFAEGYTVEDICAGITRAVERATKASRKVRSIAYCIPTIREKARQTPQGRTELGAPQPTHRQCSPHSNAECVECSNERTHTTVTGKPQAVTQVNPERQSKDERESKDDLERLADGDAELRDLLEIVQERNPGRTLRKSDVRAWKAVAERYHALASARDTSSIGLVMQAVLKAIGSHSDRDGYFAPSLAEAILVNWQREQSNQQPGQTSDAQSQEPNEQGQIVQRPRVTLSAIQTRDGLSDPVEVWDAVLKELKGQMTKATFDTWVRATFVSEVQAGNELIIVIGTRNPYAVEWLEHRLHTTIQRTVVGIVGQNATVRYQCINEEK